MENDQIPAEKLMILSDEVNQLCSESVNEGS